MDLAAARATRLDLAGVAIETPVIGSGWLGERIDGHAVLKAENLQRTGSFKVRGALAKMAELDRRSEPPRGVVAASAGNHGQAVAFAARSRDLPCVVYMPAGAPISKAEAVEFYGGEVRRGGTSVDDCVEAAIAAAESEGLEFVHPFDDWAVLRGQATLGLELAEQVPELGTVVMPIGGGGLAGASGWAIKALLPEVEVIGVQVEGFSPYLRLGVSAEIHLADGIAVKHPGRLTRPLIDRYVDRLCTVDEDAIAEAMILLMQRSKLVTEGAGAIGVAALISGAAKPSGGGTTAVVLSGGNVDIGLVAAIARRHESVAGRRLHLLTRVKDRPGALAALLAVVAEAGANVVAAEHQREGIDLHVGETGVELTLETSGSAHSRQVAETLREHGYSLIE